MKITFLGAGSTVFARNVIGDCMCVESLRDSVFALYDIDAVRIEKSRIILEGIRKEKGGYGKIECYVGELPLQCAAMNMSNINVQLLTIEAAKTKKKEHIYQAAMMDPHTASELDIDTIKKMVDELIDAHGDYLPKYN